jgi:hypothetical protein
MEVTQLAERRSSSLYSAIFLLVALLAGAVAFLPFAFDTSPWDAVMLRVPGDQGNWWHVLVGAPFFLAFPMIWLRLRSLFSKQLSTSAGRRLIWIVVGLSTCGTISVMVPFLLRRAGTSELQRLSILCLGFGILIACAALLSLRRHNMFPTSACLVGLSYLANAALCLVVYSGATGTAGSKSGWLLTMVIVWPIAVEVASIFIQTFKTQSSQHISRFL